MGDGFSLLSAEEAKARMEQKAKGDQNEELDEVERQLRKKLHELEARRVELVENQRAERRKLSEKQTERRNKENRVRAARLPTGLKALWFRVTGKYRRILEQNVNEKLSCDTRDRIELQRLVESQLCERRILQYEEEKLGIQDLLTERSMIQTVGFYGIAGQKRSAAIPKSLMKFRKLSR